MRLPTYSPLALDYYRGSCPQVFVDFPHRCDQARAQFHHVCWFFLRSILDGLANCPTTVIYKNVPVMHRRTAS